MTAGNGEARRIGGDQTAGAVATVPDRADTAPVLPKNQVPPVNLILRPRCLSPAEVDQDGRCGMSAQADDPDVRVMVERITSDVRRLTVDDRDPVSFISRFTNYWLNVVVGDDILVRELIPVVAATVTQMVDEGRLDPLPGSVSVSDALDYNRFLWAPGPDCDDLLRRWQDWGPDRTIKEFAASGLWKPGEEMYIPGVPSLPGLLASRAAGSAP